MTSVTPEVKSTPISEPTEAPVPVTFDPTSVGECAGTYKWHEVPSGPFVPRARCNHRLDAFDDHSTLRPETAPCVAHVPSMCVHVCSNVFSMY